MFLFPREATNRDGFRPRRPFPALRRLDLGVRPEFSPIYLECIYNAREYHQLTLTRTYILVSSVVFTFEAV